ncbi:MAG: T9SS type A sorting domain-containing protein, partial [Bacteroidales bacterium]|nr:T9SS type A sorting domain-containing protein [Bacteroidales bacterium]
GAETSHILIDGAQLSTGNHNYSITVTNIHGCQNSDAITITVVPVNDIDQNIAGKISITPNPTNGIININGQNINNVSIYDNIGKLLISTKNSSIDLSKYPSGMYFVKIATNENTSTYKVVKQ